MLVVAPGFDYSWGVVRYVVALPPAWWVLVLLVSLSVTVFGFVRSAGVVWYPAWCGVVVYLSAWRFR